MKINFFTPVPPARSDIANSVERMLPVLSDRVELTLWTDDPGYDKALEQYARVRVYKPEKIDWRDLNSADHSLYNIGNDGRFHASIVEVSRRHPGVVLLHDLSVQELALHCYERSSRWEEYIAQMQVYGHHAVADWRSLGERKLSVAELAARYPLTHWPVSGAHGVIVHNGPMFREACAGLYPPCLEVPLPYLSSAHMRERMMRQPPSGRLNVVICGYLNSPNRRLQEVLRALASYGRRDRITLHIAGKVADASALKKQIASLGLSRLVKLYGYVSEEKLGGLLDAAHLALNLRYPSMGEASGAQLRFWNHSLPTLVTKTGWYSRLPEGSVLFVDPEKEEADLHRYFDMALDNYPSLVQIGLAGRQVLEERHSAEVFVDALLQFLPEVGRYRKTAFAPKLAERVGRAGSAFAYGEPAQRLYSRVAGEIAVIAGQGSASVTSDATA